MYIFKPWHQWFPLGLTMTGFYITRYYEKLNMRDWNVDAVFIIFQFFAVTIHAGMLTAGLMYQRYMTDTDTPQILPRQQEIPHIIPNLGEMHQYAQEFRTVTERKEKQFAKTLLAMKELGDVDLREDRWRVHFGSRDAYIQVRSRFEQVGGFSRKDARRNSPYIVSDWRVVALVAQGETLR